MPNWEDLADRNAEEHDENVQKFTVRYGNSPEEVKKEITLIDQQKTNFYIFYEKYLCAGTASGISGSGDSGRV